MRKKIKSLGIICCLALTLLTGCGEKRNVITDEQFWIGLEQNGYSKEHKTFDEVVSSKLKSIAEYTDIDYYHDGEIEYMFMELASGSDAVKMFDTLVNSHEDKCSTKISVNMGAFNSWAGTNSEDNKYIMLQRYENIVLFGYGLSDDKESIKATVESLLTMDYTGKELQYKEPTEEDTADEVIEEPSMETEEPMTDEVVEEPTLTEPTEELKDGYTFYVSDTPITIPSIEGWEYDTEWAPSLYVKVDSKYNLRYVDSYIDVGNLEEVDNALKTYEYPKENIGTTKLNGVDAYLGYKVIDGYTFITLYQNLGLETYLRLDIDFYDECESIEELLNIVSTFALTARG